MMEMSAARETEADEHGHEERASGRGAVRSSGPVGAELASLVTILVREPGRVTAGGGEPLVRSRGVKRLLQRVGGETAIFDGLKLKLVEISLTALADTRPPPLSPSFNIQYYLWPRHEARCEGRSTALGLPVAPGHASPALANGPPGAWMICAISGSHFCPSSSRVSPSSSCGNTSHASVSCSQY